jgi:hypothetical protein
VPENDGHKIACVQHKGEEVQILRAAYFAVKNARALSIACALEG